MKKSLSQIRDENEGAFTLVELLVVILIIGILAAIAIPAFLNQRKAAVDSAVQSDVKNAATQIETWMASNPSTNLNDFSVLTNDNSGAVSNGATQGAPLTDIKVSPGTDLVIEEGTARGTYTIKGSNPGGAKAAETAGIIYNSEAGGLQK